MQFRAVASRGSDGQEREQHQSIALWLVRHNRPAKATARRGAATNQCGHSEHHFLPSTRTGLRAIVRYRRSSSLIVNLFWARSQLFLLGNISCVESAAMRDHGRAPCLPVPEISCHRWMHLSLVTGLRRRRRRTTQSCGDLPSVASPPASQRCAIPHQPTPQPAKALTGALLPKYHLIVRKKWLEDAVIAALQDT